MCRHLVSDARDTDKLQQAIVRVLTSLSTATSLNNLHARIYAQPVMIRGRCDMDTLSDEEARSYAYVDELHQQLADIAIPFPTVPRLAVTIRGMLVKYVIMLTNFNVPAVAEVERILAERHSEATLHTINKCIAFHTAASTFKLKYYNGLSLLGTRLEELVRRAGADDDDMEDVKDVYICMLQWIANVWYTPDAPDLIYNIVRCAAHCIDKKLEMLKPTDAAVLDLQEPPCNVLRQIWQTMQKTRKTSRT